MTDPLEGTSSFNLMRKLCGLSQREAADYHDVPVNTVDKWCAGKRTVPPGVLKEQRALYQLIRRAGGALGARMDAMKRGDDETIEIAMVANDREADDWGLPCVGAYQAAVGVALMERQGGASAVLIPYSDSGQLAANALFRDDKRGFDLKAARAMADVTLPALRSSAAKKAGRADLDDDRFLALEAAELIERLLSLVK